MSVRKVTSTALGVAALLLAGPVSASAQAPAAAAPRIISTKVVAPFNLAIGHSRLLVADGGTSQLSVVYADGSLKTIATGPGHGGEVGGVAISANGKYTAYTTTEHPNGGEDNANGTLHVRARSGKTWSVNLATYEAKHNPDHVRTYGTTSTNPCVIKALGDAGIPVTYRGEKDSHPFSVAAYGRSSWIVADAGGNDLLKVDARGRVSTVAVLPAQPLTITKELAAGMKLPDCVVGVTYKTEPVPTDVEVGRHGQLYVTTLPGGPEVGARGSVYRVNPRTGHATRLATGFAGATNLALYHHKIYVSEFFAGRISTISAGKPKLYKALPNVVSVEAGRRHLYAGTTDLAQKPPAGTIVRVR